jgi:sugar phosphate isomerase/epimerase
MRLGGPVFGHVETPEEWVAAVHAAGFHAAYCPVATDAAADVVAAYEKAALEANIVIAEVGAWGNPLSPDDAVREEALEKCKAGLSLADRINARCCVNIAGSRGEKWDGPAALDLTEETFEMIVDTVRDIIDTVAPTRSYYTLEPMPWMYPDSVDSYLRLITAIDRKGFAVHFDPVNLVNSPERYFRNGDMIRDAFKRLGPHIRSCHAKDTLLRQNLTVHLDELRPGLGALDFPAFFDCLKSLDPDIPVMIEHLQAEEEYVLAADYLRSVAAGTGRVL